MTVDEILTEWEKDNSFDMDMLEEESRRSYKLHSKYYRILLEEKRQLDLLKAKYDRLYLEKYEFLTQGPSKEDADKGWKLPPKGAILKSEVDKYLSADIDMINISLKRSAQAEKVDMLTDIIKQINARSYSIGHMISYIKFKNGVG